MRTTLASDPERLRRSIDASSAIGATPEGGLRRLAASEPDGTMRDLFVRWCEEAGCEVTVDRVGNVFARRPGADPSLPAVAIGSHLDTQIAGGRFDGVLGVLAGLEVVRALNDGDVITRRPIDVICWTNEEGARFRPPMQGSAVFAGILDEQEALVAADDDGVMLGDALRAIGYAGTAVPGERALDAYFELHIEQGPLLDADTVDVGIVTGGYTTCALDVVVTGETAHAGPTPMERRRNALVGAAHAIVAADEIARAHGPDAKSTSTRVSAWPNLSGIVPASAHVAIDMRHPEADGLRRMLGELRSACDDAAARGGVTIALTPAYEFGGLDFDGEVVAELERAAGDLGVAYRRMKSQAGHDAYHLATVCPAAMIFCPCKDGCTHHPAEDVDFARVAPSVEVLLRAVLARADR